MVIVSSYRFLARAGVSLMLLAAVCVVALQVSTLHPRHPQPARLLAARSHRWGRPERVLVEHPAHGGASGPPLRVLIVGASVSRGLGASTPGHDYASDLARMLDRRTGRTVKETVWSRPGATVQAAVGLSPPPDQRVVILQLSTNDFIAGTPLVLYQERLNELLDRVRATSPHASLLCLGAWERAAAIDRVGVPVAAYDAIEKRACAAHGGGFLSPSPIFEHTAWRGPRGRATAFGRGDDFHPNNLGHLHLAEAILADLQARHVVPAPDARTAAGTQRPGPATG